MTKKIINNDFIKKNKYLLLTVVILLVLTIGITIFQKSYAFNGASGTSGDCTWEIDASGKMTIRPTSGSSCTLSAAQSSAGVMKMPWYDYRNNITSVVVAQGVIPNQNSGWLFSNLSKAKSIDVSNLDTSSVVDMREMFKECSSLERLDLSGFDTSNVTFMADMFSRCSSLESLDLSSFDTSSVRGMGHMFHNCSKLTSITFSNKFDTSSVIYMDYMFEGCSSLTSLDLSNFDASSLEWMQYMFNGCSSLTSITFGNKFNTSSVTNWDHMFDNIGSNNNEGTKLTLNNAFNKTYSTGSNYYFPYSYYAKEVNGELSNELYTLSAMQTETTGSNTPTTWVPAYSVSYDKGSGDSVSGTPNPKIYRIGSKVDTRGYNATKTNDELGKWNTSLDGTGTSFSKNALSNKTYGDKYSSEGLTNGGLTLYAQYGVSHNILYQTDGNGTIDKNSEDVLNGNNPTGVTDTPNNNYKFVMAQCNKNVTLNNNTVINKYSPLTLNQIKEIKVTEDLTCKVFHRKDIATIYDCN